MRWTITLLTENQVYKNQSKDKLHQILFTDVNFKNGNSTADKLLKRASELDVGKSVMSGQIKITRTK